MVYGLPLVIDFPLGLAFGIAFNFLKFIVVAAISFGFVWSLPGRWYYPIFPRRARMKLRIALGSANPQPFGDAVDFEISTRDWTKPQGQINLDHIMKGLYLADADCQKLLNSVWTALDHPDSTDETKKSLKSLAGALGAGLTKSKRR
jgi:hypothetical protein